MCYMCNKTNNKFCDNTCKNRYISILDFLIENHKNTSNRDITNRIYLQDLKEETLSITVGGK